MVVKSFEDHERESEYGYVKKVSGKACPNDRYDDSRNGSYAQ